MGIAWLLIHSNSTVHINYELSHLRYKRCCIPNYKYLQLIREICILNDYCIEYFIYNLNHICLVPADQVTRVVRRIVHLYCTCF